VIDSTSTTCRPARFNERTVRAVARRVGWYIVVACAGTIAFARDFGWPNPGLAYWLFLWFVGWLSNTLAITEWTIAGHELSSRRWFSWPSSKASKIMDLGPDVEAVHETRHRWRVWPNSIVVEPWRAGRLVEAMEQADVRITTGAQAGRADINYSMQSACSPTTVAPSRSSLLLRFCHGLEASPERSWHRWPPWFCASRHLLWAWLSNTCPGA